MARGTHIRRIYEGVQWGRTWRRGVGREGRLCQKTPTEERISVGTVRGYRRTTLGPISTNRACNRCKMIQNLDKELLSMMRTCGARRMHIGPLTVDEGLAELFRLHAAPPCTHLCGVAPWNRGRLSLKCHHCLYVRCSRRMWGGAARDQGSSRDVSEARTRPFLLLKSSVPLLVLDQCNCCYGLLIAIWARIQ